MKENHINHIAMVLDASLSMRKLADTVVTVADQEIARLARRSKELDQETRVTVYTFSDHNNIKCVFYDKDVLRLPSLRGHYRASGNTALMDATMLALGDLAKTPELYGDHAFLIYVMTDGEENDSKKTNEDQLSRRLVSLPEHWTLAAFVPNAVALAEAKRVGFAKDNLAIWNTSDDGVREVGAEIGRVTDDFMQARARGVRGTRNLFKMRVADLSKKVITGHSKITKLGPGQFWMWKVDRKVPIQNFVESKTQRQYRLGEAYYQLTVPVKVQAAKRIAIYARKEHTVYTGAEARQILGLPDYEVKVEPDAHKDYDIFIQSTSVNRNLLPNTSVLVLSAV